MRRFILLWLVGLGWYMKSLHMFTSFLLLQSYLINRTCNLLPLAIPRDRIYVFRPYLISTYQPLNPYVFHFHTNPPNKHGLSGYMNIQSSHQQFFFSATKCMAGISSTDPPHHFFLREADDSVERVSARLPVDCS